METTLKRFATALALFAMATVGAILLAPPEDAYAHTPAYCGHTTYYWNNYSHPVRTVHLYAYNTQRGDHVHGTKSQHKSGGNWYTIARYEHYCG
jgi:hypothetical protein